MKIYVGNLPYSIDEEALSSLFSAHGEVTSASIIIDKFKGTSKGFGFIEMSDENAQNAIEALDGSEIEGRKLKVNEARPREDRPRRNFNGNGGGGGGFNRDRRGGGGGGGGRRY